MLDPLRRRHHVQQRGEIGGEGGFAQDTGQDRHRVEADLHHGEEMAGLLLQLQHPLGAGHALVRQLPELDLARGGQGDFRYREKGAGRDQKGDDEKTVGETHVDSWLLWLKLPIGMTHGPRRPFEYNRAAPLPRRRRRE